MFFRLRQYSLAAGSDRRVLVSDCWYKCRDATRSAMRTQLIPFALTLCAFAPWAFTQSASTASHSADTPQQRRDSVIIFWENDGGFPTADAAPPVRATLAATLPNARFVDAAALPAALSAAEARVLVLPYGSAFPESAWPATLAF